METALSPRINEPPLARHSYRAQDTAKQFGTKAAVTRAMLSSQLEPKRTAAIRKRMLATGLPI